MRNSRLMLACRKIIPTTFFAPFPSLCLWKSAVFPTSILWSSCEKHHFAKWQHFLFSSEVFPSELCAIRVLNFHLHSFTPLEYSKKPKIYSLIFRFEGDPVPSNFIPILALILSSPIARSMVWFQVFPCL